MSEVTTYSQPSTEGAFNARTMIVVAAVGTLAFLAMLVLGAYAPDLRSGRNGGTHALSNAATGFSGLVRLAQDTGRNPLIVRTEPDVKNEDLAVITPDHGTVDLGRILSTRGPRATLVVLPKWQTIADPLKPGWVRVPGLLPPDDPERALFPTSPLRIARAKGHSRPLVNVDVSIPGQVRFFEPAVVQSITGKDMQPLIISPGGAIVLAKVGPGKLYVLSEPDLLNNHAMGSEAQADAALALLDYLNSTDADGILFDVTANGLGRSRSPLRLGLDPPFLAVTLTIFTAMLLAAWQALNRFGPVRRRERAIAFGKAALIDNSAALVRKAGREPRLGGRYVDVIRQRAVTIFRLRPTADAQTLDERLEGLNHIRSFSAAANAAAAAQTRDELLGAAQSLNQWLEEVQR